jgi:DNA-binding CsgD family transcriptional regulator
MPAPPGIRAHAALSAIVALQAVAATAFLGDIIFDLVEDGITAHLLIETVVAAALVAGLLTGIMATRRTITLVRDQTTALRAASGALAEVVDEQFRAWGLTPAEADVALMALKGLDVADIARLRGAAQGTVRAQLARVYAKAGVTGRAQFAAWFVEDLLSGPLAAPPAARAAEG